MMLDLIDIEKIKAVALQAGEAIMQVYESDDFEIERKKDDSPLTKADFAANEVICKALAKEYPQIPMMSEENKQETYEARKEREYYWCIDPLDGTKEFIKRNGEFTVNIALIHKNTPVLGVVYAPAIGKLYVAKKGKGAHEEVLDAKCEVLSKKKLPFDAQKDLKEKITVVASKSHLSSETNEFIDNLALNTSDLVLVSKGSSLKLCMVATGEADIYPRLAPTMEWDTAAAHAIVLESGKNVYIYDASKSATDYLENAANLKPVVYNKAQLLNPWFVVR
jgi:3'(2'), 5'-bisphosphate nucleotidase